MRKQILNWGAWLLVLLCLVGCGSTNGGAPRTTQPGNPAPSSSALIVVTESVRAGESVIPQVAAYQQEKQRWTFRLPTPSEALTTADGAIYVGAGNTVYALDAQSGHLRWQVTASQEVRAISIIEGLVYVDTGGGFAGAESLEVFSLAGRRFWQYTPPDEQDIPAWLVDGGVFYTAVSGFPASLVARNATTGALRWQAPLHIDSPLQALLPAGPAALLVIAQASLVLAQRSDGAQVWRRDQTQAIAARMLDGTVYGFFVDQPAAFGGEPFVSLRALQVQSGQLLWQQPLPSGDAGFLTSQQHLVVGAITAQGCYLADGSNFDEVHAWALADGSQRWTGQPGERVEGLLADAQAVYLASSQHLFALQADTGQVRWRAANPDNLTALSVAGGILLGMNPLTSTLAGYNLRSGQLLWRLQPQALNQYIVT